MNKRVLLGVVVVAAVSVAVAVLVGAPASADKPFGLSSLNGTYDFTWVEIRYEEVGGVRQLDHCTGWGYGVFDGAGHADLYGTRRCSVTGTVTDSWANTYTVDSAGHVELLEVGYSSPTHGLLVDRGRMLLTDATAATDPDVLVHHAVGVKR